LICPVSPYAEIIQGEFPGIKIIADPDAEIPLKGFFNTTEKKREVCLLIGPESGFSRTELSEAGEAGWSHVRFGYTCLRAETAVIALSSVIIYEWGSFFENNT